MPNPISNYAENLVREGLASNEKEVQVIENSSRYSFLNRLKVIAAFGTRSMNSKAIIYPYWENVARGYEDVIALLTLLMLLFLLYPIGVLWGMWMYWWRHKGWTMKERWIEITDKIERKAERLRCKIKAHQQKKYEDEELL